MEEVKAFKTSDGKLHSTQEEARKHEEWSKKYEIERKSEETIKTFLNEDIWFSDYFDTPNDEAKYELMDEVIKFLKDERSLIEAMYIEIDNQKERILKG